MPFFLNRRLWGFLLLDATVLLALLGVFILTRCVPDSEPPRGLSERILATPIAEGNRVSPPEPKESGVSEETLPVVVGDIDLKHLRSKTVTVRVHQIKLKENFWSIAEANKIDIFTLIGANPNMPFKANVGQYLNLLSRKGVLHRVEKGETLAYIAKEYRSEEKILEKENNISWWRRLKTDDVLFVPDVKPSQMPTEWSNYFERRGFFGNPLSKWAKFTSTFGIRIDPIEGEKRKHKGLDLKAKSGDPVYATRNGRVAFAGVSGGYGNLIQIRHADAYITYYGHLSKIYVQQGQKVRRGALIGRVGATGRVTGPHLHFEIRKNGKVVDPLLLI
jgi:hypothetical protein